MSGHQKDKGEGGAERLCVCEVEWGAGVVGSAERRQCQCVLCAELMDRGSLHCGEVEEGRTTLV